MVITLPGKKKKKKKKPFLTSQCFIPYIKKKSTQKAGRQLKAYTNV